LAPDTPDVRRFFVERLRQHGRELCLADGVAHDFRGSFVTRATRRPAVVDVFDRIGAVIGACERLYCGELVTTLIVIVCGAVSIHRYVCEGHAEHAQEIAREIGGIAYRVYVVQPVDPPPA
jgi:hypothetical protein